MKTGTSQFCRENALGRDVHEASASDVPVNMTKTGPLLLQTSVLVHNMTRVRMPPSKREQPSVRNDYIAHRNGSR